MATSTAPTVPIDPPACGWPDFISGLLAHAGWTQTDLAEKIGSYQSTISDWQRGVRDPRGANATLLHMLANNAGYKPPAR